MVTKTAAQCDKISDPRAEETAGGLADTYLRGTNMKQPTDVLRRIELTKGQFTVIDAADHESLSTWKWSASKSHRNKFVALRSVTNADGSKSTLTMHRQIMGLRHNDGLEVDHINHDTLDNRRQNLRVVTPQANKRWQPSRGGSSKYVGVTRDHDRESWRAQIQVDGKVYNLGRFATEREAALARDLYVTANETGHVLNFPKGGKFDPPKVHHIGNERAGHGY